MHLGGLYSLQGSPDKIKDKNSPNNNKYPILVIITGCIVIVEMFT